MSKFTDKLRGQSGRAGQRARSLRQNDDAKLAAGKTITALLKDKEFTEAVKKGKWYIAGGMVVITLLLEIFSK